MNQRNISAFKFGQFIAKTAHAKVAQDLDNELSPDALANMAQTSALLKAKNPDTSMKRPVMVQMSPRPRDMSLPPSKPLARVSPTAPVTNTRVPPLPSMAQSPEKQDYVAEYDAWRLSQGLSPGGPKGTNPPVPLQQLGGGDTSVKLPSGIR